MMCSASRLALAAASAALLVGACATIAPERSGTAAVLPDAPFVAEGRISARHGRDAVSASFRWRHAPPRDDLELATPLGQTIAQLSGDGSAHVAKVVTADGRRLEASDWSTLTERALGFPLPVDGLAAWIRGGAHEGSPQRAEVDANGRATLLRQDGWEIVFDYGEAAHPQRIRMTYPDVEVRVVVDRLE